MTVIRDITNILTDTYRRAMARCKPSLCPVTILWKGQPSGSLRQKTIEGNIYYCPKLKLVEH